MVPRVAAWWSSRPVNVAPGPGTSRIGLAAVAALLVLFFSMRHGTFFTPDNAKVIGINMSSVAIAGMGSAILLIAGYIDLSIGSMYAVAGMIVAEVASHGVDPSIAIGAGLLAGLVMGSINGAVVQWLKLNPLIVTIGLLSIYGGLAYVINSVSVFGFSREFIDLGRGEVGPIPVPVVVAAVVFVVVSFVLTRTVLGLHVYAAGGDPRAAERMGVRVNRLVFGAYAFNGLLIGLIAVLTTAKLGSGSPELGASFEFDVLTAVILGGVAFSGGAGRPLGVLIGVITIGVLNAGLIFEGLQSWWQEIAKGSVLVIALAADQLALARRQRKAGRGTTVEESDREQTDPWDGPAAEPLSANGVMADSKPAGPVLEVKAVSKRFGAIRALDETSLALERGSVVGLLGDNGAGKSTLAKIISGALPSDTGEMYLEGRKVAFRDPADARAEGIESVYQDLALCPNLSVVHNLILGREPTRRWLGIVPVRDDKGAAEDAKRRLAALGIRLPDDTALVESLSGGQRQAIAIARAMDDNVKVVCLDEPTAALGVTQTDRVLGLVRRVSEHGSAILIITHDVASVMKVCDRVVVLRQGELVFEGEAAEMSELDLLQLMAGIDPSNPAVIK